MSLARKFVLLLIISVCSIAFANIAAFYVFYNSYIRLYLSEKLSARQEVTIEYINNIIERQTLDDIDSVFSDIEVEFFELLDLTGGKISLKDPENVNIVVDYLVRSGVSPKYIEEVIPDNNLEEILESLKDPNSPETLFITRLLVSLIIFNIIILTLIGFGILYISQRIIRPIKRATNEIQNLDISSIGNKKISYKKKDEVGLLIEAINELSEKLSVQESIRSRLLADISHELKTPITSIQCYLEGISDGVIELSDKNLNSISSEMSRLIGLVNQIMEYEQFENAELIADKKVNNPYEIITNIIATQEIDLLELGQKIEVLGSQDIKILLDENLFTQLVYNVIANFKKYAGEQTSLEIIISSKKIIFKDNGQGIDKKELPFIFEKFYQGKSEKTGDSAIRGIGVGLSIVKKIIEAHNWKSKIISDTNEGFTLEIKL